MPCLRVCCLPVTGAPQWLTQEKNSFIFNSWKTSQQARRSDFLESTSQLLRVTKDTQAPSLFLLHHPNMRFLFSRSIHSSRGLLECQPFTLIPSCRKKEDCKRGPLPTSNSVVLAKSHGPTLPQGRLGNAVF